MRLHIASLLLLFCVAGCVTEEPKPLPKFEPGEAEKAYYKPLTGYKLELRLVGDKVFETGKKAVVIFRLKNLDRKTEWFLVESQQSTVDSRLRIEALREGKVPGTHIVKYDSEVDSITITHEAKSREGFALGAVVAAEFLMGKPSGFYSMTDLMK